MSSNLQERIFSPGNQCANSCKRKLEELATLLVCKRMPVKQNMLRFSEMNPVLQCFAFFLLATTADSRGVAYMGHGTGEQDVLEHYSTIRTIYFWFLYLYVLGNNEPIYVKEGETTVIIRCYFYNIDKLIFSCLPP